MKTTVFFGGRTPEHQVSVASAVNVLNGLQKEKYTVNAVYISTDGTWCKPTRITGPLSGAGDLLGLCGELAGMVAALEALGDCVGDGIAFPVMHGPYGEDGTIQGVFEMLGMPFVGNGVLASAAAMDKAVMKALFAQAGISQTPYEVFSMPAGIAEIAEAVEQGIGYPVYVKPANMGSSVGISRCANHQELARAVTEAFRYDEKIVVEREVVGREIILAMMGDDHIRCSLPGVWQRSETFFRYEDKYLDDNLTPQIPAEVSESAYRRMCELGRSAFRAVDGSGLMRADFFLTGSGEIFLNEVNTMPGFTAHSMFPMLCAKSWGMSFAEVLDRLIEIGLRRHARRSALCSEGVAQ